MFPATLSYQASRELAFEQMNNAEYVEGAEPEQNIGHRIKEELSSLYEEKMRLPQTLIQQEWPICHYFRQHPHGEDIWGHRRHLPSRLVC